MTDAEKDDYYDEERRDFDNDLMEYDSKINQYRREEEKDD